MNNLFTRLAKNSGAISTGLELGGALTSAFETLSGSSRRIEQENQKTRRAFAAEQARRVARETRYQRGLARTTNAALGGKSDYGSAVFAFAQNARLAEEKRQAALLGAKLQEADTSPDQFGTALSFTTQLLGAASNFASDTFESDVP